jgi:roadblock/LC7 domain-containing protein
MANLNRLLKLKGAVSAGEFATNGELVSYEGELPLQLARQVAKMCAANTMMGISQAESFTQISGMKWSPFHGWAVAAGDYSVCVIGNIGVFVETAKADFNDIFKKLSEEAHVTLKAA